MSVLTWIGIVVLLLIGIGAACALMIAARGERLGIVRTGPMFHRQPEDCHMGTLFTKVPVGAAIFLRLPGTRLPSAAWPPDTPAPTDIRISIERANSAGVKLAIDAPPDVRIILPNRSDGNSLFMPHCPATPAVCRTQMTGA